MVRWYYKAIGEGRLDDVLALRAKVITVRRHDVIGAYAGCIIKFIVVKRDGCWLVLRWRVRRRNSTVQGKAHGFIIVVFDCFNNVVGRMFWRLWKWWIRWCPHDQRFKGGNSFQLIAKRGCVVVDGLFEVFGCLDDSIGRCDLWDR